MLSEKERQVIDELWKKKLDQDSKGLPQSQRHRNLEPDSAEMIYSIATGIKAKHLLEIGGSSGISTIALASAAHKTNGRLISIEIEPMRQAQSCQTITQLGLERYVDFILADAGKILPTISQSEFILIDCEKDDYIRFFDMLPLRSDAVVVADNILSHQLSDYVSHVRARPGVESITLPIGKGLEVTRIR